jgi:hypothetical protein
MPSRSRSRSILSTTCSTDPTSRNGVSRTVSGSSSNSAATSSTSGSPAPIRTSWTRADRSMLASRSPAASASQPARRSSSAGANPLPLGLPPSPWVRPVNWKMSA